MHACVLESVGNVYMYICMRNVMAQTQDSLISFNKYSRSIYILILSGFILKNLMYRYAFIYNILSVSFVTIFILSDSFHKNYF